MIRQLRKRVSMWFDPVKPRLRRANLCVFHVGRVGSSVLGDLLDQHPQVCWAGEVYWEMFKAFREHSGPEPFRPNIDYRRVLREKMKRTGMCIFGGEFKPDHLDLLGVSVDKMVCDLDRMHFRHFILLERRNQLRWLASSLRVKVERGRWKQQADEKAVPRRMRVDLQSVPYLDRRLSMFDLFALIERYSAEVEQALAGRNMLCLNYEDDIEQDPRVAYGRVCEFIGIEPVEVSVRLGRMNPFPLREMIENYDEIAEALGGTRYEWMLED